MAAAPSLPLTAMAASSAKSLFTRGVHLARAQCADGVLSFKEEVLSGTAVALAQVPEAIAFSFVAGVDPQIGLQSAFTMGIVTALFGGRPGMISGATAAIAVLLPALVRTHGEGTMFYAVMAYGIFEVLFGMLRLGSLVRLLPTPVMIGFVNGLALLMAIAQVSSFQIPNGNGDVTSEPQPEMRRRHLSVAVSMEGGSSLGAFDVFDTKVRKTTWVDPETFGWMAAEIILCMGIMFVLPALAKAAHKRNMRIAYTLLTLVPSSLLGIIAASAFEWLIVRLAAGGKGTPIVSDVASVQGEIPFIIWIRSDYPLPPLREALPAALPVSIVMAIVGLTESLLTLSLVSEMLQQKGHTNQEAIAQGLANFITGMTGGMGGCAMIGQTMINVRSGGRRRLGATVGALGLLIILLVAYPAINRMPLAGLVGVMWMVSIYTFEFKTFSLFWFSLLPLRLRRRFAAAFGCSSARKVNRLDALQVLAVTLVCLFLDLAIAIAVGIGLACMALAWHLRDRIRVVECKDGDGIDGGEEEAGAPHVRRYVIHGPLFFASAERFLDFFAPKTDPPVVEVHMQASEVLDFSGLEALNRLALRYTNESKVLCIKSLTTDTRKLAGKAVGLLRHLEEDEGGMLRSRSKQDIVTGPAPSSTPPGEEDEDVVVRSSREFAAMEIEAQELVHPSASDALLLAVARHPHSTAVDGQPTTPPRR